MAPKESDSPHYVVEHYSDGTAASYPLDKVPLADLYVMLQSDPHGDIERAIFDRLNPLIGKEVSKAMGEAAIRVEEILAAKYGPPKEVE